MRPGGLRTEWIVGTLPQRPIVVCVVAVLDDGTANLASPGNDFSRPEPEDGFEDLLGSLKRRRFVARRRIPAVNSRPHGRGSRDFEGDFVWLHGWSIVEESRWLVKHHFDEIRDLGVSRCVARLGGLNRRLQAGKLRLGRGESGWRPFAHVRGRSFVRRGCLFLANSCCVGSRNSVRGPGGIESHLSPL